MVGDPSKGRPRAQRAPPHLVLGRVGVTRDLPVAEAGCLQRQQSGLAEAVQSRRRCRLRCVFIFCFWRCVSKSFVHCSYPGLRMEYDQDLGGMDKESETQKGSR